jgi:hypothetical protein
MLQRFAPSAARSARANFGAFASDRTYISPILSKIDPARAKTNLPPILDISSLL